VCVSKIADSNLAYFGRRRLSVWPVACGVFDAIVCVLCAGCSYTEHSTVGLAQQWDQLDQLCMRMQHNLEQQIQAWLVSAMTITFWIPTFIHF